jgi:hypothetical protein
VVTLSSRLVPRFVQAIALLLILGVMGVPSIIVQLVPDDCAEECAGEESGSCEDEGCTDCSIVCSSCARAHVLVPTVSVRAVDSPMNFVRVSTETGQRVPVGPPPEGVFHPPRRAG